MKFYLAYLVRNFRIYLHDKEFKPVIPQMKISLPKEMPIYLEQVENADAVDKFTYLKHNESFDIEGMAR